jgi:hypothetical protein
VVSGVPPEMKNAPVAVLAGIVRDGLAVYWTRPVTCPAGLTFVVCTTRVPDGRAPLAAVPGWRG